MLLAVGLLAAGVWAAWGELRLYVYSAETSLMMFLPLFLLLPAALVLGSEVMAERRAAAGRCKACGYDLTGLAADLPCPECGKAKAG